MNALKDCSRKVGEASSSGNTICRKQGLPSMTSKLLVPSLATLEPCLTKTPVLSQEIHIHPNRRKRKTEPHPIATGVIISVSKAHI